MAASFLFSLISLLCPKITMIAGHRLCIRKVFCVHGSLQPLCQAMDLFCAMWGWFGFEKFLECILVFRGASSHSVNIKIPVVSFLGGSERCLK